MQFNHQLSTFTRVVKSMAGKYKGGSIYSSDDIEQECWLKIVKQLPRLNTISPDEVTLFAHVMIKNHIASLIRSNSLRNDINVHVKEYKENPEVVDSDDGINGVGDLIDRMMFNLDQSLPEHALLPDQVVSNENLKQQIVVWSKNKSPLAQRFIKELVEPSESTLHKWAQMVKIHPVYKSYYSIPPSSFAEILGCSKLTICRIMKDLRSHLECIGFGKSYLIEFN